QEEVLRRRQDLQEREERAYKLVFDKYIEARGKCGQSTDLSFDTMRTVLRQQVRQIKSTFGVESVKFKISVEDGKAKVKAVPVQQDGAPKAAS
ncbi:MAG TPA: MXAN_5187 C-terminal domain-containing protein, partial [Myxococcota bacterium]|nr:MXAN_5187 C-terminal domain-containing protein [Myxococcota bacterium]